MVSTFIALVVLLVIVALIGSSLALGRSSREAQSVRDAEFVELEGSWIRYRVSGEGPPVLLVHGYLTSSRVWEPLAGRLSERFTVYSLDLRGFGESDKPLTGYGVRNGSRLLQAFCARFGIGEVALIGSDVGGGMAVKLAADHPELARSVTLVATPADEQQIDLPTLLWMSTLPVIGPLFYTLGRYVRAVRSLWMKPFVEDRGSLPGRLVEDAAASTPVAVRSTFNTARREVSRGRLVRQARQLRAPLLVISGEEDRIVDPESSKSWAEAAPRSEMVLLEDCGHLPMVERPEEFNARLLAFLTGDERYLPEPPDEADTSERPASGARRGRREREEAPVGEPQPAAGTGGADGLEPDEEASAAEPLGDRQRSGGSGGSGVRRGQRTGRRTGVSQEDETGELGHASANPAKGPEGSGGSEREKSGRSSGKSRRTEGRGEDLIPELPDDLFRWPDVDERGSRPQRETEYPEGRGAGHAGEAEPESPEEGREERREERG